MKYFIVILIVLTCYTCRQKENREEIRETSREETMGKVYSIYLPEFADDSIQVFTGVYDSECILFMLQKLKCNNIVDLNIKQIITSETLLKTNILQAYHDGPTRNVTGYELYKTFAYTPLQAYKRQYIGMENNNRDTIIIVALWDMYRTKEIYYLDNYYNNKHFFCPTMSGGLEMYIEVFIINLSDKTVNTFFR